MLSLRAGLVALTLTALAASPALAVQTESFGLAPADGQPAIVVKPAGTTTTAVLVRNRSGTAITVDLQAVAAARDAQGTYSYGSADDGLARDVHLAVSRVQLAAHETQEVRVTVTAPRATSPVFGAITATTGTGAAAGVQQRLAVILEVTGTLGGGGSYTQSATSGGSSSSLVLVGAIALVGVLTVGGVSGIALSLRRR